LDAGGNLHGVALRPPLLPGTAALVARLLDHGAVAATARAGLRQREQSLALRHDTAAVTFGTDDRGRPRLGTRPAALAARRGDLDRNLRLQPAQRVLEREPHLDLEVGAPLGLPSSRAGPTATRPPAEEPAEQIAEVAEVVDREIAAA